MENGRFDDYAPELFEILYENMKDIAPSGLSREDEYDRWHAAVGEGMKRTERRIVLIMDGKVLAGFFQYYVNAEEFMMEEIQLRWEYQGKRQLFRRLYGFVLSCIPSRVGSVAAYTDKRNARAAAILAHMGLKAAGETQDGSYLRHTGSMEALRAWYGNAETIYSDRLVLKPVDVSMVESTFSYAGDIENVRYMMYLPFASLEETKASIMEAETQWRSEQPSRREYAVFCDGVHIGGITLYRLEEPDKAELGWVLHRDAQGHGYAAEAARAVMDRAARRWGIRSVIACCDSENTGSRRLMERLGMQHIDTGTRKNRSTGNEIRVELVYEIDI